MAEFWMRRSDAAASKSHSIRARRCMHPFRSTDLPFGSFRMCSGHTRDTVASLVNHLFLLVLLRARIPLLVRARTRSVRQWCDRDAMLFGSGQGNGTRTHRHQASVVIRCYIVSPKRALNRYACVFSCCTANAVNGVENCK